MKQINVSARQFKPITTLKKRLNDISIDIFDDAMKETWFLMETNTIKSFLESAWCRYYLHLKKADPVLLSQMRMCEIDDPYPPKNFFIESLNEVDLQFE